MRKFRLHRAGPLQRTEADRKASWRGRAGRMRRRLLGPACLHGAAGQAPGPPVSGRYQWPLMQSAAQDSPGRIRERWAEGFIVPKSPRWRSSAASALPRLLLLLLGPKLLHDLVKGFELLLCRDS